MTIEAETAVSSLSLLLSVSLAVFYIRDRRQAKFVLENEYANALLFWHKQVLDILVEARCINKDRESTAHLSDLAKLSALIEQGRFFFPNVTKADGFGAEKPPAYRGYRNLALDFLVASYNLLQEAPSKSASEKLLLLQRHFTSIVFELVRPSERLNTIRSLTDRYFVKEQSFEDFLDHPDSSAIEHIWRDPSRDR